VVLALVSFSRGTSYRILRFQQVLEAGIGVHGIKSWILAEPINATSAVTRLAEPLECLTLVSQLRIEVGSFLLTIERPAAGGA